MWTKDDGMKQNPKNLETIKLISKEGLAPFVIYRSPSAEARLP